ncbi:Uncharacterised protein [Legionella sainthelensi]|nr:Uncharacterised protein [Legionella sainthelensi]
MASYSMAMIVLLMPGMGLVNSCDYLDIGYKLAS